MLFPALAFIMAVKGFIQQIREDGKLDLALQKVGVAKMDDLSSKILDLLEKSLVDAT